MLTKLLNCNPLILPNHSELYREPPRPHSKMGGDYLTRYDGHTLAVDVFNAGEHVRLIGPPLLNLRSEIERSRFILDGIPLNDRVNWYDMHKISRAKIQKTGSVQKLDLEVGRDLLTTSVAGDDLSTFEKSNVVITMNKNNRLENIRDWAYNFAVNHEVDSAIIYDNRSYEYSLTDIVNSLKDVPLKTVYVIDWPFKFGNTGGKEQIWDSDFGIYMCWEHARWRFLQRANAVFISDIDEFPVSDTGATLVTYVAKSSHGVIGYSVRNVPPVPNPTLAAERVRLHSDYYYENSGFNLFSQKVGYQPLRLPEEIQVGNHGFYGWGDKTDHIENVVAHHFQAIHYNWRDGDWSYSHKDRAPIKKNEQINQILYSKMKETFPERFA